MPVGRKHSRVERKKTEKERRVNVEEEDVRIVGKKVIWFFQGEVRRRGNAGFHISINLT